MVNLTWNEHPFAAYHANAAGTVRGGIVLIHEVWALEDHIKAVADRYAAEGYDVIAPNLLAETEIEHYAQQLKLDLFNPLTRNEAQPKLRKLMAPMQSESFTEKTIGRLAVCYNWLFQQPAIEKRVAVTGFCFGGSYSYLLATKEPRLKAAVPYYGHPPLDVTVLENITCPILAFYGENDENLMSDLPEVKQRMHEAGVSYEAVVYPDSGHAFFNDTNPFSYNKAAASDAWKRTLAFLAATMAAP